MTFPGEAMLSTKSIFLDLTESELASVHARCRRLQVRKREEVIQQGACGDEMFIVQQGRLKMTAVSPQGKEIAFGILEAGDTFGEMAMLDGEHRSATITALEPCALLSLSRASFKALIAEQPEIAIRLMVILSHRLRHTSRLYENSVFMEVPGRLAQFLIQFSGADDGGNGTPSLEISLSQYELGTLVNASRESVNKLLKDWEEQGWIELGRNRIRILDREGLLAQVRH
jgi:CRP-like cAMP-binding protein